MTIENNYAQDSARNNQLLCLGGAVGTAVGLAVWVYSRRELSYWEKTKRAAGQVAETAAEMNPWLGVGTAALGCAALAYRLREPKSTWQRASQRADELLSQTTKHLHSWPGVIAGAALGAVSTAYSAKSRKRGMNSVAYQAADAAERFADAGSRLWRRLQTISKEAGELYPRVRKVIA